MEYTPRACPLASYIYCGFPNPSFIKDKTQAAVINIVSFRIFIDSMFRMLFNIHFNLKWPLKKMMRLYIQKLQGVWNEIKNFKKNS